MEQLYQRIYNLKMELSFYDTFDKKQFYCFSVEIRFQK